MTYFFAYNFWTVRDWKIPSVTFPRYDKTILKSTEKMTSWRHNRDVKINIMK